MLFGSTGMLGGYIKQVLENDATISIQCIHRTDFDVLRDMHNLYSLIERLQKGSIVINCIGMIPQYNESNAKNFYTVNSVFPVLLAGLCEKFEHRLIHITTDCVFSGKKQNPYVETDAHDSNDTYGVSKSLGENAAIFPSVTIIRTSIVGEEKKGKRSLLEWVKSQANGIVHGYTTHTWNGMTCLQLSKIILHMIKANVFWKGVKHLTSPTPVSKYELLQMINDEYSLNLNLIAKPILPCYRALGSVYDPIFEIPEIREQLHEQHVFHKYLK